MGEGMLVQIEYLATWLFITNPTESQNCISKVSVGLKLVGFQYPCTLNFTSVSSPILAKLVPIVICVTLLSVKQLKFALKAVIPLHTGDRGAVTVSGTVTVIRSPLTRGEAGTIVKVYIFTAPFISELFTIDAEIKFQGTFAETTTLVSI